MSSAESFAAELEDFDWTGFAADGVTSGSTLMTDEREGKQEGGPAEYLRCRLPTCLRLFRKRERSAAIQCAHCQCYFHRHCVQNLPVFNRRPFVCPSCPVRAPEDYGRHHRLMRFVDAAYAAADADVVLRYDAVSGSLCQGVCLLKRVSMPG
jgi:hypothetical protein